MEHRHGLDCLFKTELILQSIMNRNGWDRY